MHGIIYKKLISSKEWRRLRAWKLQQNPLCERHQRQGKVVAACVVHHIIDVETGHNEAECRALCFNPSNLMSLCRECHKEIHMERGTWTAKAHKTREQVRLEQWKQRLNSSQSDKTDEHNPRGHVF